MPKRVKVCDDNWHGVKGLKFEWDNKQGKSCTLSQSSTPWPFVSGPPITVPTGISPGELNGNLPDGTYKYDVDCCKKTAPKNVLIP